MQIKLTHDAPKKTGYYIVQADSNSNPHIVLVIIEENKKMQVINEGKPLFFYEFPRSFVWSEIIEIN